MVFRDFRELSKSTNNSRIIYSWIFDYANGRKWSRFIQKGYKTPKPFIEVSGEEMYLKAIKDLPKMELLKIITREEIIGRKNKFSNINMKNFKLLKNITDGQAVTCLKGMEDKDIDFNKPLIISACDMGVIFDESKYQNLLNSKGIDIF